MAHELSAVNIEEFAKLAQRIGGLTSQEVLAIIDRAADQQVMPQQLALELGKLNAADIDIINTLLAPRDSIPGYHVLGLIGRGGMGVVYRARQLSLNREVALKTIPLSQLVGPTAAARFENEAQVLARVTHPHIVAAFDFGRHAGRLFLAMELVQGRDVQALIEHHGALPELLAWHVIRQAAAGLAHAARANVIHRDIKPANLLLVNPPDGFPLPVGIPMVKIADFGLSILRDDQQEGHQRLTSANVHVGSPTYMAPEQLDVGDIDHAVDIFALGVTCWHMLVGRAPLHGSSLRQLVIQRLTQRTPPLSQHAVNCSPATIQLVEQMLEIDPRQRIRAYDVLLSRIDAILAANANPPGATAERATPFDATSFLTGAESEPNSGYGDKPTQQFVTTSLSPVLNVSADGASTSQSLSTETTRSNSSSVAPTRVAPLTRRTLSWWMWLVPLVSLAVLVGGWGVVSVLRLAPPARQPTATGPRFALFDGIMLDRWSVVSGSWFPSVDGEGAAVLEGSDGTIRRPLADLASESIASRFALEATCRIRATASARLRLQVQLVEQEGLALAVMVELQPDALVVITQRASSAARIINRTPLTMAVDSAQPLRSLRIERQVGQWWVLLDGQVVCNFATSDLRKLSSVELTATNGSVQFADLSIAPLLDETRR